jgi:hypothetical protein
MGALVIASIKQGGLLRSEIAMKLTGAMHLIKAQAIARAPKKIPVIRSGQTGIRPVKTLTRIAPIRIWKKFKIAILDVGLGNP